MPGEIDVRAVPIKVLVGSFLKAMMRNMAQACVVFQDGGKVSVASNNVNAEAMARQTLLMGKGATDAAAEALHGFRIAEEGKPVDPELDRCVCCGTTTPWAELPEPGKAYHVLIVQAVMTKALLHREPPPLVQV